MNEPLILVLDDDPTGIQTVHGVRVYYRWSAEVLSAIFANDRLAFIQTNSRSLPEAYAVKITHEIMQLAITASQQTGRDFRIISRSDSSLRGHYPAEPDTIRQALEGETGQSIDGEILCFVLPEAGRQTVDNVHAIRQPDGTVLPVSESEFARDVSFGYQNADLTQYIAEKTKGKTPADRVRTIPIDWLVTGNTAACLVVLNELTNAQPLVVNAVTYTQLDVMTKAIRQAEQAGKRYVFRTAAAFVKSYAQISDRPLLTYTDLAPYLTDGPVLTVVGSHTVNTTRQLAALLNQPEIDSIELDVTTLLTDCDKAVSQATQRMQEIIRAGRHPVLFTSRTVQLTGRSANDDLALSRQVSAAITDVVRQMPNRPRAVIAKGGITSSTVATDGLAVQQGLILGQIQPSIPVILTDAESRFPAMPYVIFPGNTGKEDDLTLIWKQLAL